jgi:hypothetical protein
MEYVVHTNAQIEHVAGCTFNPDTHPARIDNSSVSGSQAERET